MWVLESCKDTGTVFYLLEGVSYTVGRKDCKILIPNDSSVSRRHATLTVTHSDAHLSKPSVKPILTLTDSSKFGSLRNGNKVAGGSSTVLEDGDIIVFGGINSNQWRVVYKPMVVAVSSLPSAEKKSLKQLIRRLGGHMVPEWSKECTHLIMTQLTVTIKVIGALVTCRPIVTPSFLKQLEEAAMNNTQLPDPAHFQPAIAEAAISKDDVSFLANPDRKMLFKDKTVVFLSQRQFKHLGHTMELAGGKPLLLDEGTMSQHKKLLVDPNTLVIYADPGDQSQVMTQCGQEWVRDVMDILKRNGLRPIPQSEIGLAVLYASVNIHCNPKVAQAGLNLLHPVAAPSLPTQDVLASETQHTELTRSHSTMRHKTDPPESKAKPDSSARVVQEASKKRVRDEDASKVGSLSKIQRMETVMPPAKPQKLAAQEILPSPPQTGHQTDPGGSPELPYIGKQGLGPQGKEHDVENLDKRLGGKKANGSGEQEASSKSKLDDDWEGNERALKGISSKICEERTVLKTDKHQGDSTSEDISPSERVDKNLPMNRNGHDGQKSKLEISLKQKTVKDEVNLETGDTELTEGFIPPSGREARRGIVRRGVEELVAVETEEDGDKMVSWPELEVQGRRRKRKQLIEETDETHDEATSQCAFQEVPSGYITANRPVKSEPTSPLDPSLPSILVTVEKVALVCRRPVMNGTHTAGRNGALVNFKKFKKASYAGQFSMPHIIGGSDLEHHEIGHIKEAEDMMEEERETHRRQHMEKDLADKLFDWDPRPAKRRR